MNHKKIQRQQNAKKSCPNICVSFALPNSVQIVTARQNAAISIPIT